MTDSVLVSNYKTLAADAVEVVYTSPAGGKGTVITAFTASNDFTTSVSYKVYIYDDTGAVVSSVVPMTPIVRDRFHGAPSLVNQVIPAGGTLRLENSTADSLNFYSTGRDVL